MMVSIWMSGNWAGLDYNNFIIHKKNILKSLGVNNTTQCVISVFFIPMGIMLLIMRVTEMLIIPKQGCSGYV